MKKICKVIGIVLLVLVLIAGAYVAYVFADYHRIEDNQTLAVTSGQTQQAQTGKSGRRSVCFRILTRSPW